MSEATIIHFDGGHTTYLELSVQDLERSISAARAEGKDLVYVQAPNKGDNAVVIDPNKVVALYADRKRETPV